MEPEEPYYEQSIINPLFGMKVIPQQRSSAALQSPFESFSIPYDYSHQQALLQISSQFIDDQTIHSHSDDLLPTIRESPGFRLLNTNTSHPCSIFPNHFDELDSKVSQLKATIEQTVKQAMNKSLQKVECYKDFLGHNAISKVCGKLQNGGNQHQQCCKRVLERLKELDLSGQAKKNSVEDLIQQEVQQERQFLKSHIEYIQSEMMKILLQAKKESHSRNFNQEIPANNQAICWPQAQVDDQSDYLKNQEQFDQQEFACISQYLVKRQQQSIEICNTIKDSVKFNKIQEEVHLKVRQIPILQDQRLLASFYGVSDTNDQRDDIKEIYSKLHADNAIPSFEESNISNETNQLSADNIPFQRLPKGVQFAEPDILIVRNIQQKRYKAFFKYLQSVHHIKHIIIENCNLATVHYIHTMIAQNKAIEGLHIHCSFKFNPKFLETSKLQYMSFFPNYRFIRIIDKDTYFCNVKRTGMPKQVQKRIEEIIEKPVFRNMYICKNTHPPIPESIEELHFFRMDIDSSWSIRYETLFQIQTPNRLLVLTFTNIVFRYSSACFKTIFRHYKELHTIVFQNCQGYQNKGVKQLRYLRSDQLKNLQISGDNLDKKIILKPDAVSEIFRHYTLETLILTNIQFVDMMRKPLEDSSGLKSIYGLLFLTHLNLYSSQPVCDDLLKYIFKNSIKNMKMLNFGFAQLTPNAINDLSYFQKLESLCLDFTCFGDIQLLQITKYMTKLKDLSVQNLNGAPNGKFRQKYGLITPYFFDNLASKDIRYLNIYNCRGLHEYRWSKFNHIECIRINKGLLSNESIRIIRGRGTIFLIEQGEAESTVDDYDRAIDNVANISPEISNYSNDKEESYGETNTAKPQKDTSLNAYQEGQISISNQAQSEKNQICQGTVLTGFNCLAAFALPPPTYQDSSSDMLSQEI